jgi:hypothetical protein
MNVSKWAYKNRGPDTQQTHTHTHTHTHTPANPPKHRQGSIMHANSGNRQSAQVEHSDSLREDRHARIGAVEPRIHLVGHTLDVEDIRAVGRHEADAHVNEMPQLTRHEREHAPNKPPGPAATIILSQTHRTTDKPTHARTHTHTHTPHKQTNTHTHIQTHRPRQSRRRTAAAGMYTSRSCDTAHRARACRRRRETAVRTSAARG